MGSISSPSRPQTPSPSPELDPSNHRIFASFCLREPSPDSRASTWIESYDPNLNKWIRASTIPFLAEGHVLKGFSMVSLRDSIFVIGGRLCVKEMAHVSDEVADLVDTDVEILGLVLSYNVRTGEWSRHAGMKFPRSDFACSVLDGKIYVAGGQSSLTSARGISSAEVYDPAQNEWTTLPNMYTLRYKCVGVTWQGKIHVVGGFAERLGSGPASPFRTERSSVEAFDPRAGRWELKTRMWQLDVPPNQIVAVDGRLFSSGDCLKVWKGHIESYDAELNIWNEVDNSGLRAMPGPMNPYEFQELYLTMAPIRTKLYFLGGYRNLSDSSMSSQTISIVSAFNTLAPPGAEAWRSFEPTGEDGEKEICSHCCVVQLS